MVLSHNPGINAGGGTVRYRRSEMVPFGLLLLCLAVAAQPPPAPPPSSSPLILPSPPPSASPAPQALSTNRAAIFGVKDEAALQMHVYVFVGNSSVIDANDGKWKSICVQFIGGGAAISSVSMQQGTQHSTAQHSTAQIGGSQTFFLAADVGGEIGKRV